MPSHPKMTQYAALASASFALATSCTAHADNFQLSLEAPTLDRWNYPFNSTPGTRGDAPSFGSGNIPALFDDRDGQMLIGFQTGSQVPTGLGASNYQISNAVLKVAVLRSGSGADVFRYDPTYDSYRTYLPIDDPDFDEDRDTGRPIALFGTGYRNGFSALSYQESTPFSFDDPSLEGVRNAFALTFVDGTGVDASNNVRDRFEVAPFAIGAAPVAPGDIVPSETDITFTLDLSNPDVVSYLQQALDMGVLNLSIASMHSASQTDGSFPRFYTKENALSDVLDVEARIEMTVETVPSGTPAELVDFHFAFGSLLEGGGNELTSSDDVYLRGNSQFGFSAAEPNLLDLRTTFETQVVSPSTLNVTVESFINNPGGTATVRIKNVQSKAFETIGTYPIGQNEVTQVFNGVDTNDRVRSKNGRFTLSVKKTVIATFSASGFVGSFDRIAVDVE